MAKKQKIDVAEYLKGLPGLDDATRQSLVDTITKSPDALKRLQDELMTVSDYQSNMADLQKQQKAAEDAQKKADELRLANEDWYRQNVGSGALDQLRAEKAQADALLASYRQTYGDMAAGFPSPSPAAQPPNPGYVTKKDLEDFAKMVTSQNQDWSAGLLAVGNRLSFDHFKRFGEPLDMNQLIEAAKEVQKNPASPVEIAYQRLTEPRQKAAEEAAQKARDEQLKKDWERDWRSRQGTAMEQRPEGHSPLYDALRRPAPAKDVNPSVQESDRLATFISEWRQAGDELAAKENA